MIVKFKSYLIGLPRRYKKLIAIIFDYLCCIISTLAAFLLRLGDIDLIVGYSILVTSLFSLSMIPIFYKFGVYDSIFRYFGGKSFKNTFRAILVYSFLYFVVFFCIGLQEVPRTIGILQPLIFSIIVIFTRIFARGVLLDYGGYRFQEISGFNVLVYGAGSTGRQFVSHTPKGINILGFIDDNKLIQGEIVFGNVVYSPDEIQKIANNLKVDAILLAMPSISRERRHKLIDNYSNFAPVRSIPSFGDILGGLNSSLNPMEINYEDLLGRDAVSADPHLLQQSTAGKVVLISGAGGSIGSELARQLVALKPLKIILFEQNEFGLFSIERELQVICSNNLSLNAPQIIPILGSILDHSLVNMVIADHSPNIIYHAAAYKHVKLVEHNPFEGIKVNVFGADIILEAAGNLGVDNFVLVSTDKAVRPTNIMGATKRCSELLTLSKIYKYPKTTYSIVRFGNVLGSSGSVIPIFSDQIKRGGPITVTSPDVKRYFMTIPEAVQLIIQTAKIARSGDLFVLDMGEPIKILELAKSMVKLFGLTIKSPNNLNGDIEIKFTGLLPAEKMCEELSITGMLVDTEHSGIKLVNDHNQEHDVTNFIEIYSDLELAFSKRDKDRIIEIFKNVGLGYTG